MKELVAELNEKYKSEIDKMKDLIQSEYSIDLIKIKEASKHDLEEMKLEYEAKISQVRSELKKEHELEIEKLRKRLENADSDSDESLSGAVQELPLSDELCKKLKDQVKLTQELDKDLLATVNENLSQSFVSKESISTVPDNIKVTLCQKIWKK